MYLNISIKCISLLNRKLKGRRLYVYNFIFVLMDILTLIITGALINHFFVIFSTIVSLISKHLSIYKFDSSGDQINTEELLKEIKSHKSFVSRYTYKEGVKRAEGFFYNYVKFYNFSFLFLNFASKELTEQLKNGNQQ